MQLYKREVVILLNLGLNFKSRHIIKDAIAQIERKLGKFTCENPLEKLKHLKMKNKNFYNLF